MAKNKKSLNNEMIPSDPVYRIPDFPIDADMLVDRALMSAEAFRNDRELWYERRAIWYTAWDDYVSPTRKGTYDGESNYHLPLIEPQVEAMKAQILAAVFFSDTPFHISAQEDIDIERTKKIKSWMKYVVLSLANNYRGIYEAIDDWAHYLTVDGVGILSRSWFNQTYNYLDIDRNEQYRQFVDLLTVSKENDITTEEFLANAKQLSRMPYKEVMKVGTHNYPLIRATPIDNVLFKGFSYECMDLNSHDTVIEVIWLSKSQLIQLKKQGIFDEDVVNEIIERGRDRRGSTTHSTRAARMTTIEDGLTGITTLNSQGDTEDKYEFYKVFDRVSLNSKDKHSLENRLVYYVHGETGQLAGWNFLDRISATRKITLHMAHLYKRPGRTIARGMVETMFSHGEVSDNLLNQAINAGTLANNPMFAWRGDSTFDPKEFRAEPGLGVKTDDPNNDIRMLTFNVNPTWAMGILQLIETRAQQMTAIGSERFGQVGLRVGATRSNAGLQTLMNSSDRMLNMIYKFRIAPCLSELFTGIYADSYERITNPGRIPILGMDGVQQQGVDGRLINDDISREDLAKNIHFVFNVTASNMNKEQRKAEALEFFQLMSQPIFLKTNAVSIEQVFNLANFIMDAYEIPQKDRFINQKMEGQRFVTFKEEMAYIIQGMMPPIGLSDPEHEDKIRRMEEILDSETAMLEIENGKVHPAASRLLELAIQAHMKFLEVQNKAQNMQNPTGSNIPLNQSSPLAPDSLNANTANTAAQPQPTSNTGQEVEGIDVPAEGGMQ